MSRPSILVTYKLPSSAIDPLSAVGDVEVFREGVLTKDELIKRIKGKQAVVVAALDKIDKDGRRRQRLKSSPTSRSVTTTSTCHMHGRRIVPRHARRHRLHREHGDVADPGGDPPHRRRRSPVRRGE
jgi:hypothetical protein